MKGYRRMYVCVDDFSVAGNTMQPKAGTMSRPSTAASVCSLLAPACLRARNNQPRDFVLLIFCILLPSSADYCNHRIDIQDFSVSSCLAVRITAITGLTRKMVATIF